MREEEYLLWFTRINNINMKKKKLLLKSFGRAKHIWNATQSEIAVALYSQREARIIQSEKKEETIKTLLDELRKKEINYTTINSQDYPKLLKTIYDQPIVLYYKGRLPDDEKIKISLVGARRCSEYGETVTYNITSGIAKHGVVIVSGMARGIDSIAHKAAIDAGGETIAVLGCGVDICYPPKNRELMNNIIQNGCVISESPPGTPAMPYAFPIRNRIISGISNAIIVTEASLKSGTLITVDQALEQGREVFAVPGNITSMFSEGTNNLIKQGAAPITCYADVFENLNININDKIVSEEEAKRRTSAMTSEEKIIYLCISYEPVNIDSIVRKTNMPVRTIQQTLTMLEIKGNIKQMPGNRYIRA